MFDETHYQSLCVNLDVAALKGPAEIPESLILHDGKSLRVYYAPMSLNVPKDPKILIAGLTPGWAQAREAYAQFRAAEGNLERYKELSKSIAFKGSMRTGIFSFFTELGINSRLNVHSAEELFQSDFVASTSILRYPVFKKPLLTNYSGSSAIEQDPFLRSMIRDLFEKLVRNAPHALIIPMGKWPERALAVMARSDPQLESRVLWGFPHMSGANNGRRKPAMDKHGEDWKIRVTRTLSSQPTNIS